MARKPAPPELWSDFDGTAVEILPIFHPRNWVKFPLSITPGYADFLAAVEASGVTIGGIISKRPSLFRYWPTLLTIRSLKLDKYFYGKRIVLAGSNRGKGRFIASRAQERSIGMLEDKPHKLLPPLLAAISKQSNSARLLPITIGVVNHNRSESYINQALRRVHRPNHITQVNKARWDIFINKQEQPAVTLVLLDPYSGRSARAFVKLLSKH